MESQPLLVSVTGIVISPNKEESDASIVAINVASWRECAAKVTISKVITWLSKKKS